MTNKKYWLIIISSLIIGYCLTIIPVPSKLWFLKPDWVLLVVIYWSIALPHRFSTGSACFSGLGKDLVTGGLLGQSAFSYCIIAYLCNRFSQRIRLYPILQQSLTVMLLSLLSQLSTLWIAGTFNQNPVSNLYWLSSLLMLLLWPWTLAILRNTRRRYKIS